MEYTTFLATPIEKAPRIAKKIIPALKRLGINTIQDLLFYFPARYDDFSNQKKIIAVSVNEVVTIQGKIQKIATRRTAKKRMYLTEAVLEDDTGKIKALWFNQPFIARNVRAGDMLNLSGKIALGPKGIYLQNPAYEKINRAKESIHTAGLAAIYPETAGISSRWLRFLIKTFIPLSRVIEDPLPQEILRKYRFPEVKDALYKIHFPKSRKEAEDATKRFKFETLFMIQLHALKEKKLLKSYPAPIIPLNIAPIKKFVASLPYELTNAQRRSIWEILKDISKPHPMNRLLEGDVGSGKTIVAAAASLLTSSAGFKVIFMAPTEILAHQHFETLQKALLPFQIQIGLLTGSQKKVDEKTQIIIGTHALIQKNAQFENVGLVIIDEQHRFGVAQRAYLTKKPDDTAAFLPHFLSMTATPIPRTLSLTIYGDLDLSILNEMPKSRKEIITKIVDPLKRSEAYKFIREKVEQGQQVFVICPRIEPVEIQNAKIQQKKLMLAEVKTVKEEYKKLSENIFPDLKIEMLHGKIKPADKEKIMKNFANRKVDILVSTSVIEVGVDIPNATIMMIEGAERFGLAQLHQFRGRVGRGQEQSYCFLFPTEDGLITRRLRALVDTKNGFELAEKDLEIRGPGDLLGNRQWGISNAALSSLTDVNLIREVRNEAINIIKEDPGLIRTNHKGLKKQLDLLEKRVHLE